MKQPAHTRITAALANGPLRTEELMVKASVSYGTVMKASGIRYTADGYWTTKEK